MELYEVTKKLIKDIYIERPKWSYKGNFGKLLVIGGSRKYSGAPALVGLSALKSGVDLAVVAAPRRSADIIAGFSPNLITEPLEGDSISDGHMQYLLDISRHSNAIVMGSGMGLSDETKDFVLNFIDKIKNPCVLDADALKIIKKRKLNKQFVLTPHAHEFYIMTDEKPVENIKKRAKMVRDFAKEIDAVVLLKGNTDVISDGKETAINVTGNPYMTKGGTGDVLSGIIGALLARGVDTFDAATAGAYISGTAGDLAAKKYGDGLLATDVIEMIPSVIKV